MFEQSREIIRISGFGRWLWIVLRLHAVAKWFEAIIHCHHNARVIADFESRMIGVIYVATDGRMSQAYYDEGTMLAEINDAFQRHWDDGYSEGRKNALEEHGLTDGERN